MTDLLQLDSVSSGYGDLVVARDVSFTVAESSITVLLGRNGAGKTTLLRTIAGLNKVMSGDIRYEGSSIVGEAPYRRRKRGIGFVQENKRIFKRRTVEENLMLGGYGLKLSRAETTSRMNEAFERFPILADKRAQTAGYLSGGQQQMLAISQALFSQPKLLLLDEPFSGLAPSIVADVMAAVRRVRDVEGRTVLLVEQAVDLALSMSDAVLVLDIGRVVHRGRPGDPGIRDIVASAYFGAAAAAAT
ncbi:MAG: putative branched-chain amino acid transporter ATP-binding protein [Acidimicrobiia bacterium]|nr:putative branched-chain amino acid transporter ATP-binding protein [Acidimicrobiia bacterium]